MQGNKLCGRDHPAEFAEGILLLFSLSLLPLACLPTSHQKIMHRQSESRVPTGTLSYTPSAVKKLDDLESNPGSDMADCCVPLDWCLYLSEP